MWVFFFCKLSVDKETHQHVVWRLHRLWCEGWCTQIIFVNEVVLSLTLIDTCIHEKLCFLDLAKSTLLEKDIKTNFRTSHPSLQVQQARLESDEYCLKLERTQQEGREVKASLEREAEQVRRELLGRLRELEALPDRLRRSEQQLRDAQQEAEAHERRNMEHSSALSEVRHKVRDSLEDEAKNNAVLMIINENLYSFTAALTTASKMIIQLDHTWSIFSVSAWVPYI